MPERIILEFNDQARTEFTQALHVILEYLRNDDEFKQLLVSNLSSCVYDACLTYLWKNHKEQLEKHDFMEVSENSAKDFIALFLV